MEKLKRTDSILRYEYRAQELRALNHKLGKEGMDCRTFMLVINLGLLEIVVVVTVDREVNEVAAVFVVVAVVLVGETKCRFVLCQSFERIDSGSLLIVNLHDAAKSTKLRYGFGRG